jgi:DNA polymerase sigma
VTTPVKNAFVAPSLFAPNKASVSAFQGLALHPLDPLLVGEASAVPVSSRRTQLNELIGRARSRSLDQNALAKQQQQQQQQQSGAPPPPPQQVAQTPPILSGTKRSFGQVEQPTETATSQPSLAGQKRPGADAHAATSENHVRAMAVALVTMPSKRVRGAETAQEAAAGGADDGSSSSSSSSGDVKKARAVATPVATKPATATPAAETPATTAGAGDDFIGLGAQASFDGLPVWCSGETRAPTLHSELVGLCELLDPLESEDARRREAVARLQQIVTGQFGPCDVCVFGSLRAGCALPSSDVDVTLVGRQFPDGSIRGKPAAVAPLRKLEQLLRTSNSSYNGAVQGQRSHYLSGVTSLPNARVPIIKWSDWRSGIDLDISFNMTDGSRTSQWVRDRTEAWPCFRPLLLALKLLLKQRGLADPATGGVGSFTLAVMLTSFLNARPKQYRTAQDRRNNVSFDLAAPLAASDLGRMLCEFFHFYGVSFNSMRCMVLESGVGIRSNTEHALYVVNPIDPSKNVASASFRYEDVHDLFRHCYHLIDSSDADVVARYPTRLARIIFSDDDLLQRSLTIQQGVERRGNRFPFGSSTKKKSAPSAPSSSSSANRQQPTHIILDDSDDDDFIASEDDNSVIEV